MRAQERILREQLARVACETCGADHQPDDMLVLAQRGSRWLVLLTCRQCPRRCIFVASFPNQASPHISLDPLQDLDSLDMPQSPSTKSQSASPSYPLTNAPGAHQANKRLDDMDSLVTLDDVERVRRFLDGFNGDFRSLFGAGGR